MKENRSIPVVIALIVLVWGMVRADEAKEPPVKYRLEVDGKAYPLVEGEPIKLSGALTTPTVKLVARGHYFCYEPFREFNHGGVTPDDFADAMMAQFGAANAKKWAKTTWAVK